MRWFESPTTAGCAPVRRRPKTFQPAAPPPASRIRANTIPLKLDLGLSDGSAPASKRCAPVPEAVREIGGTVGERSERLLDAVPCDTVVDGIVERGDLPPSIGNSS